jgi:hypothetical protein
MGGPSLPIRRSVGIDSAGRAIRKPANAKSMHKAVALFCAGKNEEGRMTWRLLQNAVSSRTCTRKARLGAEGCADGMTAGGGRVQQPEFGILLADRGIKNGRQGRPDNDSLTDTVMIRRGPISSQWSSAGLAIARLLHVSDTGMTTDDCTGLRRER